MVGQRASGPGLGIEQYARNAGPLIASRPEWWQWGRGDRLIVILAGAQTLDSRAKPFRSLLR